MIGRKIMGDQPGGVRFSDTCVFCKVVMGAVRADIVYQDEAVVAFRDIHPQAPVHILVIPRVHMTAVWEADESHADLLGRVILACNQVAEKEGVDKSGYRVVVNAGPDAGQSVDHLHFHLLGGRKLDWPPG
jgi:histidine triad (HIT) family protein